MRLQVAVFLLSFSLREEVTMHSAKKINEFILFCPRFFVTLQSNTLKQNKISIFSKKWNKYSVTLSV